jgi:hypothetical protein
MLFENPLKHTNLCFTKFLMKTQETPEKNMKTLELQHCSSTKTS